jgi:hypothetical protein
VLGRLSPGLLLHRTPFQMPRNSTISETQLLRKVEELLAGALPPGWSIKLEREPGRGRRQPDGIFRMTGPDGATAVFVVGTKRAPATPQTMLQAIDQLDAYINESVPTAQPLVAAPYLSARAKEVLAARGVSYADSTGNLRLVASVPAISIERSGASKDPWPLTQPLRSLRGRGAGRAVRALVDFRPPYGVREIAARASSSPATLSRVIDLLEREALLTKDPKGGVTDLDWAGTIRRWSQDYELRAANATATYLDPRGLAPFVGKLAKSRARYAATGALAAQRFAPIAPARMATIYVDDATVAADRYRLQPADSGANVLLVEPFDDVVFDRTQRRDELVTVAPTQLAADLLTGPGREPSEGEELLAWMKANEDAWRA